MQYRREIDGLRAVAVLPVILFHAGLKSFSGGFIGVDLFFVISGYLITKNILADLQKDSFSIVSFYERRARRILPALYLVLLVCLPVSWYLLLPEDMESFSKSLLSLSIFASNLYFRSAANYFDTSIDLKPLIHTWSLSIEEQYYAVFPLLLLTCWSFFRKATNVILASLALTSFAFAQALVLSYPVTAFYLLPTRAWELLVGAVVALYMTNGSLALKLTHRQIGGATGLALILFSIFAFNKELPFPSWYTLVPVMGAALIILCAETDTYVGKLLGFKIFTGIGLISYSAYLWHQPIFAFVRHGSLVEPRRSVFVALSILSFAFAYVSWKYVERPFRDRGRFTSKQIAAFGILGGAALAAFASAGWYTHGFASRVPKSYVSAEIDLPRIDNGWCFYSIDSIPALSVGSKGLQCWLGDKTSIVKGVLFGDSFAGQFEPLWDVVGREAGVAVNAVTTNWCYPSTNREFTGPTGSQAFTQCVYNRKFLLKNLDRYDFVILAGNWGDVLSQEKIAGVLELIDAAAAKSKLVIVMASPKLYDENVMTIYKKSVVRNAAFDISQISTRSDLAAVQANSYLEKYSGKYRNVIIVGREVLYEGIGGASDLTSDGIPYSLDGSHISIYGAKVAASVFLGTSKYAEIRARLRTPARDSVKPAK